ncbi:MAG TPA: hypothetical protein VJT72_08405 [Pseudonocardiaceae bacterium]|nr:hypothetical protein [Pseudonocardiaceae bacterium]
MRIDNLDQGFTDTASSCSPDHPSPACQGRALVLAGDYDISDLIGTEDGHRAWRTITVLVTSVRDGFEHLVDDAAMTAENAGRYVALCGHAVQAAALVCPPGPPCQTCAAVRNAVAAGGRRHRRTDQHGMWARLTARLRLPRSPQYLMHRDLRR